MAILGRRYHKYKPPPEIVLPTPAVGPDYYAAFGDEALAPLFVVVDIEGNPQKLPGWRYEIEAVHPNGKVYSRHADIPGEYAPLKALQAHWELDSQLIDLFEFHELAQTFHECHVTYRRFQMDLAK